MSKREDLRRAVEVSPDNVPLLVLYAEACLEDLAPEDARTYFERVLALDPSHADAQIGVARVLFFTGKASEAAVRLEALLAREPRNTRALLLYARVLLADGEHDQALEMYERAAKIPGAPQDAELARELGVGNAPAAGDSGTKPRRVALTPGGASDDPDAEAPSESILEIERPQANFEAVGGMDAVKQELRMKVLYPLRNPDLFRAYGKKVGGGVLLFGPPGCGKTLLSRACAGEMQSTFMAIGIHEILDMWMGSSERLLHSTFDLARRNNPCILFFDEVDALAADRVHLRHSAGRTLINQFLAELDGGDAGNDGVLVIGATNAPWHVDAAFLRPGRFDRVLFVPPPDEAARAAIIEILARPRPVAGLDPRAVARKTRDFSGADLSHLFDVATERCLERAMRDGRVIPLTTDILLQAVSAVRPTTKAWFESARNYALYANQSGLYDDVLTYLGIKK